MIIYDQDNKKLDMTLLMLTRSEAKELADALHHVIEQKNSHSHVNNSDCSKEITVGCYDPNNPDPHLHPSILAQIQLEHPE